jgi:hypothetical protein
MAPDWIDTFEEFWFEPVELMMRVKHRGRG